MFHFLPSFLKSCRLLSLEVLLSGNDFEERDDVATRKFQNVYMMTFCVVTQFDNCSKGKIIQNLFQRQNHLTVFNFCLCIADGSHIEICLKILFVLGKQWREY